MHKQTFMHSIHQQGLTIFLSRLDIDYKIQECLLCTRSVSLQTRAIYKRRQEHTWATHHGDVGNAQVVRCDKHAIHLSPCFPCFHVCSYNFPMFARFSKVSIVFLWFPEFSYMCLLVHMFPYILMEWML